MTHDVADVVVDAWHPLNRKQRAGRIAIASVVGPVVAALSMFALSFAASITMVLGYFGYRAVAGEERAASVFGNVDANRGEADQRQPWIDRRNGFGPEGQLVDPAASVVDEPFPVRAGHWLHETASSQLEVVSGSLNDGARVFTASGERPMSDSTARTVTLVLTTNGAIAGLGGMVWAASSISSRASTRRRDWEVHDVLEAGKAAVGIETRHSDDGTMHVTITNNTSVRWDGVRIAHASQPNSPANGRIIDSGSNVNQVHALNTDQVKLDSEVGIVCPKLEPGKCHVLTVDADRSGRVRQLTGVAVTVGDRNIEYGIDRNTVTPVNVVPVETHAWRSSAR